MAMLYPRDHSMNLTLSFGSSTLSVSSSSVATPVDTLYPRPPSQALTLHYVNGIALLLLIIIVICRFWVRGFKQRALEWDDWICGLATLTSITYSALILYNIQLKLGVPIQYIDRSFLQNASNVRSLASIGFVYPIVAYLTKLAILLLFRRMFDKDRILQKFILVGGVILTAIYLTYVCLQIATISGCTNWTYTDAYRLCKDTQAVNIFQDTMNLVTDIVCFLFLLRGLQSEHSGRGQNIGLDFVIFFAFVACAIALARLIYQARISTPHDPWAIAIITSLSVAEVNLGIILSCTPILPCIIKHHSPRSQTPIPEQFPHPPPSRSKETYHPKRDSRPPPPPPKNPETSQSRHPPAPPSSRIDNYPTLSPQSQALYSPWRRSQSLSRMTTSPRTAIARTMSPDRVQYVELADHDPVSPFCYWSR